jgi:hypothetical protein
MPRTSIHLEKKGRKDDRIVMTPRGDLVEFEYRDGDKKGSYEFTLSRCQTSQYLSDLLFSLPHDADPFHYIQVTPSTGPSILYPICELDNDCMRELIEGQLMRSLREEVTYNRFA